MALLTVGLVGLRGMVGSVLLKRMLENKQFETIRSFVFSTSAAGFPAPTYIPNCEPLMADANSIAMLKKMDVILTCQGSEWTRSIFPNLRRNGWKGYWIDAASFLRYQDDSVIVLDPVNKAVIEKSLRAGIKNYVGGNCTVSLMMMALHGLFRESLIDWLSSMTYQAVSGAGAAAVRELLTQMQGLSSAVSPLLSDPLADILEIDQCATQFIRSDSLSKASFKAPIVGSLIPWIDEDLGNGQSREEWKGEFECNKILGYPSHGTHDNKISIDGLCVRVGAIRCHSQALTVHLKKDLPLDEVENLISSGNDWVKLVPNSKEETLQRLSPAFVSGTLDIAIGRLKKMKMGDNRLYSVFTVGDQLLWGAAEPLWRMLQLLISEEIPQKYL